MNVTNTANEFSASRMSDIANESHQRREFTKLQRKIQATAKSGKLSLVTTRFYVDTNMVSALTIKGFIVDQDEVPTNQPNVTKLRTTIKW